jgi:hypothetical protein
LWLSCCVQKDVLADLQDVPASIKQAKEQAMCGNSARPFMTVASSNSSSSSSTCSYSPHHTAQSLGGMQQSPAVGSRFTHAQAPGVHLQLQQQQQQLVRYTSQQQVMQQQGPVQMSATPAWPQGMQQQQQQLAAASVGPVHVSAQVLAHHHSLPRKQQQQQQLLLPSAGLLLSDGIHNQSHHHQQQQQLVAPGAVMPDVIASVIAALDLPTHSAALAPNTSSAASSNWAGANSSSMGLAGVPLAVSAAGQDWALGGPQAYYVNGPSMVQTQNASACASMFTGWVGNASSAPSHLPAAGTKGSYQQQQGLHVGQAGSAMGQVLSLQYLDGAADGGGFGQQQQAHLSPEQQLQLQLQSHSLFAPGHQHMVAGAQAGVVLMQQGGVYGVMQAGIPTVAQGSGIVMNGAQLTTAASIGWPQQAVVLSAAML